MGDLMTADRDRLDAGFAGNRLLSTFAEEARAAVEPFAERVDLNVGEVVLRRGANVQSSLFPFGSTMISLLVEIGSGRSVEVASIGREGAVGGIVSCGDAPAFTQGVVLVAGPALRVPMRALETAKKSSPFIANIFCRYSDYLLALVMQSVACSAFHSIDQRAAGWLLMAQDRAGDRIELTQEALAGLLGVQRTSVNAAIGVLESEGLIVGRRGVVQVLDRAGLIRHACECYGIVQRHFAGVIGPSGSAGSAGCN
jgi:CRP-like cAMP-binding protein